ncbi:YfiR family protein [Inquilinus sp. NPDC058860]|uniref:YfiR family protein n=1 Tax=Inquilinus sp. NPDC058860 TaxID=3346652 RepID=UPI00367E359E
MSGCRRWLPRLRRAATAGAALLALAGPGGALAQDPPEDSPAAVRQVVMGIISYTRWPVEPPQLRLCVIGPADYAGDLLAGATQPSGRPVRTVRLGLDGSPGGDCDVVYLGRIGDAERRQLFARMAGHAVLSISEQDESCTVGSMFCLDVRGLQVSFQINLDSVARSGVRVSPKVLQLGRRRETSP